MTKEQRTSLNILIDLAIRKGIDFELSHSMQHVYFMKDSKTINVYTFGGEDFTNDSFKRVINILNNHR